MASRRRAVLFTVGLLSFALGIAGVAWACSPDADLGVETGTTAPGGAPSATPGQEVQVTGERYLNQSVDIQWNAIGGPVLTTADGPAFTVTVTVPEEARPGQYYEVYGTTQTDGGTTFGESATIFITEPETDTRKTEENSPGSPSDNRGNPGRDERTSPGRETNANGGKDQLSAKGGDFDPAANRGGNQDRDPGRRPARGNGDGNSTTNPGATPGTPTDITAFVGPTTASSLPPVVDDGSGRRVFGGSVGPQEPLQVATEPEAGDAPATGPSAGSASSDLWSGFTEDGSPSLLPGISAPASGDPAGMRLAIGIVLMGTGLVVLLGGLVIADRRRRALAHVEGSRHND